MNDHDQRIKQLVDETKTKITAYFTGPMAPLETRSVSDVDTRLNQILTDLILKFAISAQPDKCVECNEELDNRLRERCLKHCGILLASDYARKKALEHGPMLAARAAMGAQSWLEKILAGNVEKPNESKPEEKTP